MIAKLAKRLHLVEEGIHVRVKRIRDRESDVALVALMAAWARTGDYDAIPTKAEYQQARDYVEECIEAEKSCDIYGLLRGDRKREDVAHELFCRYGDSLFTDKPDYPLWLKMSREEWEKMQYEEAL